MRFTIRDLLWLMVVVGLGIAWALSKQHQAAQLRELERVRGELESVAATNEKMRQSSRIAINALIRELEKDRGRIGHFSFHPDRENPTKWHAKLEMLDSPISESPDSH